MSGDPVSLSIAVCTRNRPGDLADCVRSILGNPGDFDLIVIDQSDTPVALDNVTEFAADRRLRHLTSATRGLSRARNEAMAAAGTELLAFTDDDCRVSPRWVEGIRGLFERESDLGLAYGRVIVPQELWQIGFTAGFEPAGEIRHRGRLPRPLEPWGIGANMVVRRRTAVELGGFDPFLGAGTSLHAGEELDLALRMMGAGHTVAYTKTFEVTHLGVRPYALARALYRNYDVGTGAAYAKNLRLGTPGVRGLFFRTLLLQLKAVLSALARGRRPHGLGQIVATLTGATKGMLLKLNRGRHSFEDR